jgi:hypothetical protein
VFALLLPSLSLTSSSSSPGTVFTMFRKRNATTKAKNIDDNNDERQKNGVVTFKSSLDTAPSSPLPTFSLPRGAVADHSPTIVNTTEYPVVVFLERGTLYNAQVLHPGEAVCMTRKQTGGVGLLPYKVHALIGDEASLPKRSDSLKNLVKVSVIPAAFIAGCLATAMSAGTLAGPSAALAPLVSGMVVRGVVIDTAALAAGSIMASRAQMVTELLLRTQRNKFMTVSNQFLPGQRYLKVTGGLTEGPLQIEEVQKRKVRNIQVTAIKAPMTSGDVAGKPTETELLWEVDSSTTTSTSEQMEILGEDPKPLPIENNTEALQLAVEAPTLTSSCFKKEHWLFKKEKVPSNRPKRASDVPPSKGALIPATVL